MTVKSNNHSHVIPHGLKPKLSSCSQIDHNPHNIQRKLSRAACWPQRREARKGHLDQIFGFGSALLYNAPQSLYVLLTSTSVRLYVSWYITACVVGCIMIHYSLYGCLYHDTLQLARLHASWYITACVVVCIIIHYSLYSCMYHDTF